MEQTTVLLPKFNKDILLYDWSEKKQAKLFWYKYYLHTVFIAVRAGESLMKLVSDIKQYLILNDFPSVNEAITQNSKLFRTKQQECDQKLMSLRDDIAADLYDLEDEYFTSIYK